MEVLAEGSRNKFVFNKRGKLKDDEIKELTRTSLVGGRGRGFEVPGGG